MESRKRKTEKQKIKKKKKKKTMSGDERGIFIFSCEERNEKKKDRVAFGD